jgi:glycosyl-4,4'-diaponeurosporenoate acyltransferase
MRIFELPLILTILIDFAAWFVIHMGTGILPMNLPDRLFEHDSYLYRSRDWERSGEIWQTLLRVRAWKDRLPDGAALFKKGFPKKKLRGKDPAFLATFIRETRRAELTHWIAMPPALLFFLWNPPPVGWIMIVYALVVNTPCIIAQRYNRTRLQRVLKKAQERYPQEQNRQ